MDGYYKQLKKQAKAGKAENLLTKEMDIFKFISLINLERYIDNEGSYIYHKFTILLDNSNTPIDRWLNNSNTAQRKFIYKNLKSNLF